MLTPIDEAEPVLAADLAAFAERAANEGVPTAAIARIIKQPFDMVYTAMRTAHALGHIGAMPKPDWPPGQRWDARVPTVPRTANIDDMEFSCKQLFRLTNLETGFLMVLLRYPCADKDKLHGVIEQQRMMRQFRPDSAESTDPKMVDVMICKLRKKLRDYQEALVIQTSWGKGYFLDHAVKQAIYSYIGVTYAGDPQNEREAVAELSA